jgi:hypothetical protein
MFRALGDRLRSVPNWWLEPVLAALLFAVVAGTSLGYVIPPSGNTDAGPRLPIL